MDSTQYPRINSNCDPKRGQNGSTLPRKPQKDAYARLLSQHTSSKYNLYLYEKEKSSPKEGTGPPVLPRPQSNRVNIPQQRRVQTSDYSDLSDVSPSSLKSKAEERSLLLCMDNLGIDSGQRGDTTASHDGDIDSAEELTSLAHNLKKPQRKIKDPNKDISAMDITAGCPPSPKRCASKAREQEGMKNSKKKSSPKSNEEEKSREGKRTVIDANSSLPKSSHCKNKNLIQPHGLAANLPNEKSKNRGGRGSKKQVFEPYMSSEEVSHGLKRGDLIQGPLRINPKNYHEAFIPSPDGTRDIFLDGIIARNRALNGDIVVVEVLSQDQWKVMKSDMDFDTPNELATQTEKTIKTAQMEQCRVPEVTVDNVYSDKDETTTKSKDFIYNIEKTDSLDDPSTTRSNGEIIQCTAKVVYIVERKHSRAATGFLKFLPEKPFALFSPVDHRVPRINVPLADCPADFTTRPGDCANTLYICRITNWGAESTFAEGRLAKTLGQAGEIEPETEGILVEYGIDFSEFSDEVLDCLPKNLPWTIPPEELRKRRDLRRECIFTIDPATARDLDDALSCKRLSDGNFEVGVHIADVTYFVEEGNALDEIARSRATSVYLVQKVVPMLPRLLCEELCSLNPLTDRLTFSVIWKITPEGKILSEWFGRSVIRSCVKLSYDHAQSMIEAPDKRFSADELPPVDPEHPIDEIHQAVLNLHLIAKHLRAQRFTGGALRLDQLKLSFTLDKETMMPQGCFVYQYKDSNKLVEEFMLLANIATAHHIYKAFPDQALLRRHPPPLAKMVDDLQEMFDQLGLDIDLSCAGALHRSLHATLGDDEYSIARKEVLTNMCSRPMQMAVYFCTGELRDETTFQHYALNVPLYTHFTSPIRRYADVIVHRLLASSLGCGRHIGLTSMEVQRQASHCNDKKTAAKRAHELSSDLFFGVFVKDCGPLDSEAMVMRVLDQSFDVLVLRYGVQKRIYCKTVPGVESFHHSKIGKKMELSLVWSAEEQQGAKLEQIISVFTLVDVQLKADNAPSKYSAILKRPDKKAL